MSSLQGEMLVTGLVILIVGVFLIVSARSVSTSIKQGVQSLFGLQRKDDAAATWGIRGAGIFFILFGIALEALAIFTM
jgi:hypothetical protein